MKKRNILITLFKYSIALCLLFPFCIEASSFEPLIYLRPNETPVFTELYQRYGLLNPPALHVYDSSIYIGQPGEEGGLLIRSSQTYFNDVDKALQAYHSRIGNLGQFLDTNEKYIFSPSNGSLQIIFALVYAVVTSEPDKKFLFVEKIPFYSFHEHAVSYRPYPNARFQGFNDPQEIKLNPDEVLVEFVTSPNNPDGKFREPYTDAKIIIADFVFAAPPYGSEGTGYVKENLEWLSKAKGEGRHIFAFNSVSKALGKPGYRLGYMWFPMGDSYGSSIFTNYFSYLWKLTVGDSTPGVAEALNLMSAITALPDAGQSLRSDAFNTIVKRHKILQTEFLKRYPGSEVSSIAGSPTFFARLNSPDTKTMAAKDVLLKTYNVAVDNGNTMGATDEYLRINLCGYSGDLAEFLNRLAGDKKYKAEDLLIASANHCSHTTIHSNENSRYVVIPNDCTIDVDAENADVTIILPQFINYQYSNLITIKKLDSSPHAVTVQTETFTATIKEKEKPLQLQWTQAFFLNGQWDKR
ncbi:hypothetical protein B1207_09715 [Legionella quinlivanii]|uniref:Alliinase C-terminal domain-containing protein n=1 Tax=Legionella quinlivanii TaxID=45073 RepID=A0A364LJ43_9GAMM|nr:aminotransferase class I/II-fold pyridoxal phosphate-dependent enzyme [Legionella quinlivanii]RAP36404.1 hypothetical protein B1207_09715 [Legionella quinlivanii]